jgi:hypothetical protein
MSTKGSYVRRVVVLTATVVTLVVTLGLPSSAGGGAGWDASASSSAPEWARSMTVAVRDASGSPVHFTLSFTWDDGHVRGGYEGCSPKDVTAPLARPGLDYSVSIEIAVTSCASVPTRGVIRITYRGRHRRQTETIPYDGPDGVTL